MTRNAINAIAEQNEDEEDDDDDVPQNEMDGPKGGLTLTTEAVDADNDNDNNDNNNGNDNNMSVDRGRTVLGLEFEGQGYTPSTTITPAFAPLMDPIKSTTGSIILTSLESGPGSGQNQVAGVGSGAGQGSGLNRGYKDKDMSVLILGTCALPCTALIL
jgi:hypothetical protein